MISRNKNGAQGRSRTTDTRIFSPLLYQLSYLGAAAARRFNRGTGFRLSSGFAAAKRQGPLHPHFSRYKLKSEFDLEFVKTESRI